MPVLLAEEPFECSLLVLTCLVHGTNNIFELGINVGIWAANTLQSGSSLVRMASHDETAGGVGDEEGSYDYDGTRNGC